MANEDLKVITGKVRLGYPHLFKAKAQEEGEPKFSAELLIPKADTKTVAKIRAAQNAAAQSEKGRKLLGDAAPTFGSEKFPHKKFTDTLRDGDDPDENDGHPERAGHWFISVRSSAQYKPGIVDKNRDTVFDESQVYGGVWARVSMAAFAFDTKGKKGVSFGLNNVQVLGYGDPFGAPREAAEDEFNDEFEDADAPAGDDGSDDMI